MKLRQKFKNWLFKEELEDLKTARELYEAARNAERQSKHVYNKATKEHFDSIKFMESILAILDVGVDISLPTSQEYSWAVVCIKGHPEYVKFVDITGQDASQVLQFLRHFEKSNVTVDSPVHFRQLFEGRFIKNPFK